ncbi:MAG: aspartate aminotransferase [Deltaproteobacteria bacterium RIFCSPLOWO2_12_FULL_40_28]|nr:MAG: aspartate aminotransferase [Deltaproteobacteria bacterium RIFCSPHIGHO2_02_FULL_40_28]OGQ19916.1 MAG: aspartate aminotransferase [Deltaproteobacteria bacterium RIFCSPHIGHO2_12_FULL_40_32]OGQ39675.1 MAG: aspartate aminotransferase [Deltaproteobacteria bacterium RIFCSPLOWO2_02_FULL_40_36]OGQ52931.1 MAG: aspartate aminotransferase [Deltaproteobacteria bacterium RIFCSPLOWO2_12_FULL_40_28]
MNLSKRVQRIKPSPTLAITAQAATLKAQGIDVVSFGAGEPDFDTPDNIKQAAIDAIKNGFTKYTAVGGIDELKEAIIHKIKTDLEINYSKQEILISNGGKHSLYNIAQVLFEEGDEVIIPAPYWVSYPDQVLLNDAQPIFVETTDQTHFKILPEQLEKAITQKTKAFILNTPSNPTGTAYSRDELLNLAKVLEKHKIFCIADEIYDKIVYNGFKHVSIASLSPAMKELTLIVNGASKAYSMTGWRMGYAAGPEKIIAAMAKVQGQVTSNVCSITQKACVEAFKGSQNFIAKMVSEFEKRRDMIVDGLNAIPGICCFKPQGAFYVFPNIQGLYGKKTPQHGLIESADSFANYLLQDEKVVVVPGEGFGAKDYMRLSYASSLKNIEEGLKRIQRAAGKLTS